MSRGPIAVYANGVYYGSVKEALRAHDLLEPNTTSSDRTCIRQELRSDWSVKVHNVLLTPAWSRVLFWPENMK